MVALCLHVLALLQPGPIPAEKPGITVVSARPAPDLNALFENQNGWIGADGVYSVPLTPTRSLWLFSDTWVGKVKEGKRFDATIVNNTVATLEQASQAVQFFIQRDPAGKPSALVTPPQSEGWFWLQAGIVHNKKLYLFLSQVKKTGAASVFGFQPIGQSLAIVDNPLDPPTRWHVQQVKLPHGEFSRNRELSFGVALLIEGGFLYVYGVDDVPRGVLRKKSLVVGRVPLTAIEDFAAWRFYHQGQWVPDPRKADPLAFSVANEGSVSYLPALRRYVYVYTESGLSPRILARSAPKPWGPWSAASLLYQCPEAGWDKKIFCYGAKAHPELAKEDELVISYVANSFDFCQVASDARLYWPRFLRVKVGSN
jgi:hypothetical protein